MSVPQSAVGSMTQPRNETSRVAARVGTLVSRLTMSPGTSPCSPPRAKRRIDGRRSLVRYRKWKPKLVTVAGNRPEPTTGSSCEQNDEMEHWFDFGSDPPTVTVTTSGTADVEEFIRMNEELVADPGSSRGCRSCSTTWDSTSRR